VNGSIASRPSANNDQITMFPCSALTVRFGGRGCFRVVMKGYDLEAVNGDDVCEVPLKVRPLAFTCQT